MPTLWLFGSNKAGLISSTAQHAQKVVRRQLCKVPCAAVQNFALGPILPDHQSHGQPDRRCCFIGNPDWSPMEMTDGSAESGRGSHSWP
jgi:hypothetical protein